MEEAFPDGEHFAALYKLFTELAQET